VAEAQLLAKSSALAIQSDAASSFYSDLRTFSAVPDCRDYGIVAMAGVVLIYDSRPLRLEGVVENALYVRESQRPVACMAWSTWLSREWEQRGEQVGPAGPLTISREVVQAIRWPHADSWALRLSSGHVDGPYHEWAFGRDLIGRIVGIYHPGRAAAQ
jgi:hypothetical protein